MPERLNRREFFGWATGLSLSVGASVWGWNESSKPLPNTPLHQEQQGLTEEIRRLQKELESNGVVVPTLLSEQIRLPTDPRLTQRGVLLNRRDEVNREIASQFPMDRNYETAKVISVMGGPVFVLGYLAKVIDFAIKLRTRTRQQNVDV